MAFATSICQGRTQNHCRRLPKSECWSVVTSAIKLLNKRQYNAKGKPFVLRRQDLDVTILPNKYISELRTIPNAKLSRGKANFMVRKSPPTRYLDTVIDMN